VEKSRRQGSTSQLWHTTIALLHPAPSHAVMRPSWHHDLPHASPSIVGGQATGAILSPPSPSALHRRTSGEVPLLLGELLEMQRCGVFLGIGRYSEEVRNVFR
jgi:hypothetical protein